MISLNKAFRLAVAAVLTMPLCAFATDTATLKVAVGVCASCHGPGGRSIAPRFPVLAGQHAKYLENQLHAFKDRSRGDPDALGFMWGMAAPLTDDQIAALAEYYSHQTPPRGESGDAALVGRGSEIYHNGNSAEGIPACASCHGDRAQGKDLYPRLAGQHAQYLLKQLHSFQDNSRNVAVMHGVAQTLHENEMQAIAAYLQSLGP